MIAGTLDADRAAAITKTLALFAALPAALSLTFLHVVSAHLSAAARSLHQLLDGNASRPITEAVAALGKALRLGIVTEGVETEHQHRSQSDIGCDDFQGFVFARPVQEPAAEWFVRTSSLLPPPALYVPRLVTSAASSDAENSFTQRATSADPHGTEPTGRVRSGARPHRPGVCAPACVRTKLGCMDLRLGNQVAFVAGSSRGIGRAIASALLAEGARIVLTGRDETSLRATAAELTSPATQDRILALPGDFTHHGTVLAAFDHTLMHFGRLDHLVANLGTGSGKPGWDQPNDEWTRLFELNFFAATRLTQAALPHLLRNDPALEPSAMRGSILYISSIVAVEATPAPLPYSAAKAALNNYAKNLARQLGPQHIRVNTIAPGNIYFPGGSWERHLAGGRDNVELMLKAEVPQQRFGTPEEIAALAVFLCSPRAAFTTGSCYVADGGQTRSL